MAMTPHELANLQNAKVEREKAADAKEEAEKSAERKRIAEQNRIASEAIERTQPFLGEVRDAMKAQFEFHIARDTEGKASSIALRLPNAAAAIRKDAHGNISVKFTRSNSSGERTYDRIATAADLTNDNLSDLIQFLIRG